MNASDWKTNASIVPASRTLVLVQPGGSKVRAVSLIAAAAIMGSVTTAGHASNVSQLRLGTQGIVELRPCAREEDAPFSISKAMDTIKRKTGATWDDLARIFGVSRQAVYAWVKGGTIKAAHEEKVRQILERVEGFGELRPFQIRNRLFADVTFTTKSRKPITDEPVILTANHSPLKSRVKVVSAGRTKIVRT